MTLLSLLWLVTKTFFAYQLGMALSIVVKSFNIQKSAKYELSFWQAVKVYTTKYTGPIVAANILLIMLLFGFPTLLAVMDNNPDGKFEKMIRTLMLWDRIVFFFLGILGQLLGFMIVGRSEKYLRDAEKQFNDKN